VRHALERGQQSLTRQRLPGRESIRSETCMPSGGRDRRNHTVGCAGFGGGQTTDPVPATHPVAASGGLTAPVKQHKTARLCSAVAKDGQATCFAIRQTDTVQPPGLKTNAVSPGTAPDGYGPRPWSPPTNWIRAKEAGRRWPSSTPTTTPMRSRTWPPTAPSTGCLNAAPLAAVSRRSASPARPPTFHQSTHRLGA